MLEPHEEILPEDVSEEDAERILKKLATEIVSRRLTAPAIFLLESCSPLSFIGGQAMIVLEPFIMAIFDLPDYRKFALMMERRENVQKLITMIEAASQEQKLAMRRKGKKGKKRKIGFLRNLGRIMRAGEPEGLRETEGAKRRGSE